MQRYFSRYRSTALLPLHRHELGTHSMDFMHSKLWCHQDDTRVAILDQSRSVTFGTLRHRVGRLTQCLRERLAFVDEPVIALLLPAGLEFISAFLASLDTGAVVVPIDPEFPGEKIARVLQDANASLVLGDETLLRSLDAWVGNFRTATFDELEMESIDSLPAPSSPWKGVILYTSGSTGAPKGVYLPGEMLIHEAIGLIDRLGIVKDDRISHVLSPSVIGGLREIFSALLSGATLIPMRVRELGIDEWIAQLTSKQVTVCRLVSSLFRSLCYGLPADHAWRCRRLYIGGEPLLPSDIDLFRSHFPPDCQLDNVFGATEFGLCCHFSIPKEYQPRDAQAVPIGLPNADYRLSVVNEDGTPAVPGTVGRLVVAGKWIAKGYRSQDGQDRQDFPAVADLPGWRSFTTSDLVRINPEGLFEHCGRIDTQIKVRGHRVELGEVEDCLLREESVLNAAVVARSSNGRTLLYGVVERRSPSTSDLRRWCQERLPPSAVPQEIIEVPALPKTVQGKCDRQHTAKLVELHLQYALPNEELVPCVSEDHSSSPYLLESLWRQATNLSDQATLPNSTTFSADSLSSLEFLLNIRKHLGVEVTPNELLTHRKLDDLRALLQTKSASSVLPVASHCLRLTEQFPGPALFLLHGVFGDFAIYNPIVDAWKAPITLFGVEANSNNLRSHANLSFRDIAQSALASIRGQQPKGPYLLAGYSYGGVLAFEVARELIEQGEEVAFCGLIDSFMPYSRRFPKSLPDLLSAIVHAPSWMIDSLTRKEMVPHIQRLLQIRSNRKNSIGNLRLGSEVHHQLCRILMKSCDKHTLGSWPRPLWLYHSRIRPLRHSHRIVTQWRLATGAEVIARSLPGNHETMILPPYSTVLAEMMMKDIQSVLAGRTRPSHGETGLH